MCIHVFSQQVENPAYDGLNRIHMDFHAVTTIDVYPYVYINVQQPGNVIPRDMYTLCIQFHPLFTLYVWLCKEISLAMSIHKGKTPYIDWQYRCSIYCPETKMTSISLIIMLTLNVWKKTIKTYWHFLLILHTEMALVTEMPDQCV